MSKTDDLIIEAIRSTGRLGEDEYVTEAAIVYVSVSATKPSSHQYGDIYLGGTMPHHSALGLAHTWIDKMFDSMILEDFDDENPEEDK
jgi:hypothetical protein